MDNSEIIIGKSDADGQEYKFYRSEIIGNDLLIGYTDDIQVVAHILASNIEIAELDENGCVSIEPSNFNDSFEDMMADLTGEDEDEDDDDQP